MNLELPIKARQAGKVALQEARVAAERFRKAKFDLQRRVLESYYDLALVEERSRIQRENVELLGQLVRSAQARVEAGAPQQDLLKAQIEHRLAQNELDSMKAQARSQRAILNALLNRPAEEPLEMPEELPARPAAADDRLIAMGVAANPDLAELAAQVAGRKEALELARLRYVPDIIPSFAMTGGISQSVGAAVMLPTNVPAIRGAIAEANAMLHESRAMERQLRQDRAAAFVTALVFMRSAEHQAAVLEGDVLPLARQAMDNSHQAYAAGTASYLELIDTQRLLLNLRLTLAQLRAEREKRLAELESLAGVDVETLGTPPASATPSESNP
jgi:outer membrane protein TolC